MAASDPPYVAIIGPGRAGPIELRAAEELGAGAAEMGAVVVTGGLGGVMEAACRGARSKHGTTVGLLPGEDRGDANGWVDVAIATGIGELRNGLIVRTVDAVAAVGGGSGTLSEIALALKLGRPVLGVGTWEVQGVEHLSTAREAVARLATILRV